MATKKKPDPTEIKDITVVPVDNSHAVMALDDHEFRLRPDQVHNLRRQLNAAFVDLH